MSVDLSKSIDYATAQANEIVEWSSKLIIAVTKIRENTQSNISKYQQNVQTKIDALKEQADQKKRRILENAELESSRTIRANFRLIFGPPRAQHYPVKRQRYAMETNRERINVIRGLSQSHPHGVLAFSIAHPTKVWTESSSDVFEGLVNWLMVEEEWTWPEEITDIMDELEGERPMCAEFSSLRGVINPIISHFYSNF